MKTIQLDRAISVLNNIGNIDKVVGGNGNVIGLIGSNTFLDSLGLLRRKGVLNGNHDLNNISEGIYAYYPETSLPKNTPNGITRGVIIDIIAPVGHCIQIAINVHSANKAAYRGSYNNKYSWGPWRYLTVGS